MAELVPSSAVSEVCITYIDSPNKFFVVTASKVAILESIRQEIEKELNETAASLYNYLPSEILNFNTPCIASWNGRWYRARILTRRVDGKFDVEYVDYGNIETVDSAQIKKRPLSKLINETSVLSWPCRLGGDVSRMSKRRFEEICASVGGRFKMQIDDADDETGQMIVTLYLDDGKRLKSVNETVIGNGQSADNNTDGQATGESGVTAAGPARRTFIGPIGGGAIVKQKMTNPPNYDNVKVEQNRMDDIRGQAQAVEVNYPLVDLSEPSPMLQPTRGERNIGQPSSLRTMSHFVSDLDAILNGPVGDADSDEDEEEYGNQKRKPKTAPVVSRGIVAGLAGQRGSVNWSMSSDSGQSISAEDDSMKALRQKWSHLLSLRYGALKIPAPGSLSAEQQVTITRILSPTEFFAQTVQQRDGLRRLEASMEDEFHPSQPPIPVQLLAPDICCAVYSEVSRTWRRGQILRVNRSQADSEVTVDVYLIDTGFERTFPATAPKPINEHFTTYLPLVFYVRLAHPYFESIRWRPEDTEAFRKMVEGRTLMMKFMTNVGQPEVELLDMMHTCTICSSRVKKCTVNDIMIQCINRNGGFSIRM